MNQLKLFKTFWGFNGTAREAADMTIAAGFNGLEAPAPTHPQERDAFIALLQETGPDHIAEICTTGSDGTNRQAKPAKHLADLKEKIIAGKPLKPRFFNVMAGCDAWPLDMQIDFFKRAVDVAAS